MKCYNQSKQQLAARQSAVKALFSYRFGTNRVLGYPQANKLSLEGGKVRQKSLVKINRTLVRKRKPKIPLDNKKRPSLPLAWGKPLLVSRAIFFTMENNNTVIKITLGQEMGKQNFCLRGF